MPGPNAALTLPAATRMLLASDGSTTQLLEALLGLELHVRVTEQRGVLGSAVPRRIRQSLGLEPGETVLDRRSRLHSKSGAVVSVNRVVARPAGDSRLERILTSSDEPIGRAMRRSELAQARRVLHAGLRRWPSSPRPCAFKEYLIICGGVPSIYVHETFSPDHVPVSPTPTTEASLVMIPSTTINRARLSAAPRKG